MKLRSTMREVDAKEETTPTIPNNGTKNRQEKAGELQGRPTYPADLEERRRYPQIPKSVGVTRDPEERRRYPQKSQRVDTTSKALAHAHVSPIELPSGSKSPFESASPSTLQDRQSVGVTRPPVRQRYKTAKGGEPSSAGWPSRGYTARFQSDPLPLESRVDRFEAR